MRFPVRKLFSAVFVVLCLAAGCLLTPSARADSYSIFNLGGDNVTLVGLDASGNALLKQFGSCAGNGNSNGCYEEFTDGAMVYRSDVAPTGFVADNGTACAAPAGLEQVGRSVCDNSFQVTGAYLGAMPGVWETYPGSASPGDFVYEGSADVLFVNGAGDFVVADGLQDSVLQVMAVAQTPEPSTMTLLATGAFGLCGLVKRRNGRRGSARA